MHRKNRRPYTLMHLSEELQTHCEDEGDCEGVDLNRHVHLPSSLATTIQYQRYGLVCKENPSFESCVEGNSYGREILCTLGSPFRGPQHSFSLGMAFTTF